MDDRDWFTLMAMAFLLVVVRRQGTVLVVEIFDCSTLILNCGSVFVDPITCSLPDLDGFTNACLLSALIFVDGLV